MSRIVLLSDGLNTSTGFELIRKQLKKESLHNKTIYLFYEPYFSIVQRLQKACIRLGFQEENIILSSEDRAESKLLNADYVYVTEGNTFQILKILQDRKLLDKIRKSVSNGATYIGASAGAMIAGVDIQIARDFDDNEVGLENLNSLRIIDAAVIPHYTKKETRMYLKNSNQEMVKKYTKIYSVGNGQILVL